MLNQQEFEKLFNERNHNPPFLDSAFDEEFDAVLKLLEPILLAHASAEEFTLWPYHNRARFVDVAFSSEAYLQHALIQDIQRCLRSLPEDWMVSLWEASFLLVRHDEIQCFAPLADDAPTLALLKACSTIAGG